MTGKKIKNLGLKNMAALNPPPGLNDCIRTKLYADPTYPRNYCQTGIAPPNSGTCGGYIHADKIRISAQPHGPKIQS